MMKQVLIILAIAVIFVDNTMAQNFVWAKHLGATGASCQGRSIATDASGNVYTTGVFFNGLNDSVDFDPGPGSCYYTTFDSAVLGGSGINVFIQKMDAAGNFLWAKQIGKKHEEISANSIATDAFGNIYIAGYFYTAVDLDPGVASYILTPLGVEDIFIAKLNASGDFIWARQLGGVDYEEAFSIAVDQSGNVYTTGQFESTVDFDPGPSVYNLATTSDRSTFISRLDQSGNFVWAKMLDGTLSSSGKSIATDTSGNLVVTGYFSGTVDFDPGSGTYHLSAIDSTDIFVLKLDNSGSLIWAKEMGGVSMDHGADITTDLAGNVFTTGFFTKTVDFDPDAGIYNISSARGYSLFVHKMDKDGNFLWARAVGDTLNSFRNAIAVDGYGYVYVTGNFKDTIDMDPGVDSFCLTSSNRETFIQKLDPAGNFVWAVNFGNYSIDGNKTIAVSGAGDIYTTGIAYAGTSDFDPGVGAYNITALGYYDILIEKLSQPPVTIDPISSTSVTIYPNPSTGKVQIMANGYIEGLTITDMSGRIQYSKLNVRSGYIEVNIPTSGLYLYNITVAEHTVSGKIIIEN